MQNFVKEKRNEKGYTQREIANKINITINQLSNIENNKSIPSVEIALKLSDILDTEVEKLFKLK